MKYDVILDFPDRKLWLEWRHRGIGSSDASIIMGKSRFKTPAQLLLEKAGPPLPENEDNKYIKERGNRIELVTRELLEAKAGYKFSPGNAASIRFPFLRASLDGINHERKIITEIKLLSSQSKEKINKTTDGYLKWVAARNGVIPAEYYPQIQHQLFITGFDACNFVGVFEERGNPITGDSLATCIIERDEQYIKNLVAKECEFWFNVDCRYKNELE